MFEHNQATEAGGLVAAIEAGTEILRQAASPGKLFVLNASVIPQCSSKRNEQRALGTNKEKTVLAPGSRVFTDLGLKCIEVGCSVELFLFPNQFMDVSTLAEVCCVSSGHVHLYWAFGLEDDDDAVLLSDLRRTIARQTAVLRVRTSCVARITSAIRKWFVTASSAALPQGPGSEDHCKIRVLETDEDIPARREEVLSRFNHLKEATRRHRIKLEESRRYQYFQRKVDELLGWVNDRVQFFLHEDYPTDLTELKARFQKQEAYEAEVRNRYKVVEELDHQAHVMFHASHYASKQIEDWMESIHGQWRVLLDRLRDRAERLRLSIDFANFRNDCQHILRWMAERESFILSTDQDVNSSMEQLKVLQKKHEKFQKDLANHEHDVIDLKKEAHRLMNTGHADALHIRQYQREVNDSWQELKLLSVHRQERLIIAHEKQRIIRELSGILGWLREKSDVFAVETGFGEDLASVQLLQRKHENLELELAMMRGEITAVEKDCDRVAGPVTSEEDTADMNFMRRQMKVAREMWEDMLSRCSNRKLQLVCALEYQTFLSNCSDLSAWYVEMENILETMELADDVSGAEALLKRHHEYKGELEARDGTMHEIVLLRDRLCGGCEFSLPIGTERGLVTELSEKLSGQREQLLLLWERKCVQLTEMINFQWFMRDAERAEGWIVKQQSYLLGEDFGDTFRDVGAIFRKQAELEEVLMAHEEKAKGLDEFANCLIDYQSYNVDQIRLKRDEMRELRRSLTEELLRRRDALSVNRKIFSFQRDCYEFQSCAFEKMRIATVQLEEVVAKMSTGDMKFVHLSDVKRLKRKHDVFERDLNALADRFRELNEAAGRLMELHPDQAQEIYKKQSEIQNAWSVLTARADKKKTHLKDAYDFGQFVADFDYVLSWLDSTTERISYLESAHDVSSAEVLLELHHEHRTEIEAKYVQFQSFEKFGNELITSKHYASEAVKERLRRLQDAKDKLEKAWRKRQEVLDQCLELQQFNRDCDTIERWMECREKWLQQQPGDYAGSTHAAEVELAIKRHEDLDRAISAKQDKIDALSQFSKQLLSQRHYDGDGVRRRLESVLSKWGQLKTYLVEQRTKLCDIRTLQDFSKDADEIEAWIADKLTFATTDAEALSSFARRVEQLQHFKAELCANSERVSALLQMGRGLVDNRKLSGIELQVQERMHQIIEQWQFLVIKTNENSLRLYEAAFRAGVKDIESWFNEKEESVNRLETGKDPDSIAHHLKKHRLIEKEVEAHLVPLKQLTDAAQKLEGDNFREISASIKARYDNLKELCKKRKADLVDSDTFHRLIRDIEEMSAVVRDNCEALTSFLNENIAEFNSALMCKANHKRLDMELRKQLTPAFEKLQGACRDWTSRESAKSESFALLKRRTSQLENEFGHLLYLNDICATRMNESVELFRWQGSLNVELMWLNKRKHELDTDKHDTSASSIWGMLKAHDVLTSEMVVHRDCGDRIRVDGYGIRDRVCPSYRSVVDKSIRTMDKLFQQVSASFDLRRKAVHDSVLLLQFNWKVGVVQTWIEDRLVQLKAREQDIGHNHTIVRNLIDRHDTFEARLKAFTGMDALEESFRALPKEGYERACELYDGVCGRWRELMSSSGHRRRTLEEVEAGFEQIEDLFLRFAQRASFFNGWFENAEEDVSDPVQCHSYDEVIALISAQQQFRRVLLEAHGDFDEIMDLHRQIGEVKVGAKPYTWFTADKLLDILHSLERAMEERDVGLMNEQEGQNMDNELRMLFAKVTDEFYSSMSQFRASIRRVYDGCIQDQLKILAEAEVELSTKFKAALENIESISRQLEDRAIVPENRYTVHTPMSLAQSWDQSRQVIGTMIRDLKQHLTAMSECRVSNRSFKEYTMMFRHFDKDRTGQLNYTEFKNCLRALGYKLPTPADDESEEALENQFDRYLDQVDYTRSGSVNLSSFITFMISQETELIRSAGDLIIAIKVLTQHGHRPYITKEEIFQNLPTDVAEFCIRKMPQYKDSHDRDISDAYDYEAFILSYSELITFRNGTAAAEKDFETNTICPAAAPYDQYD